MSENRKMDINKLKELVKGTIVKEERVVFTLRSLTDPEEVEDEDEKKEHSIPLYIAAEKLYKQFWVIDEVDDSYNKDNIMDDVHDRLSDYYSEHNFTLEDIGFGSDDIVVYFSEEE